MKRWPGQRIGDHQGLQVPAMSDELERWGPDRGSPDIKTLEAVQSLVTERSGINVGEKMAHSTCRKGLFKVIASDCESRVSNGPSVAVEVITNDDKIHSGEKE